MATVRLRLTVEVDVDEMAIRTEVASELERALTDPDLEARGTAYWALPKHWETARVVRADWDLQAVTEPTRPKGDRFGIPLTADEESKALARKLLEAGPWAVDEALAGIHKPALNTLSALRWFASYQPGQQNPRTVVHQLSPLAVEGDLATFLAPPVVLAGDVLVIQRSGRILWRLADGSEGGTVAGVLDGDGGPIPPQGWGIAGFTPVARLGRRPGEENWTMGLVGGDGKLRSHDGTELEPVW